MRFETDSRSLFQGAASSAPTCDESTWQYLDFQRLMCGKNAIDTLEKPFQSTFAPEAFTTLSYLASSARMKVPNSSGELVTGSAISCAKRLFASVV